MQRVWKNHFPGEGGGHQAEQRWHDSPPPEPAQGQLQQVQGVRGAGQEDRPQGRDGAGHGASLLPQEPLGEEAVPQAGNTVQNSTVQYSTVQIGSFFSSFI